MNLVDVKPEDFTLPDVQLNVAAGIVKQKLPQAFGDLLRQRKSYDAAGGSVFGSPRSSFGNAKTVSHASILCLAATM